MGGGIQSSGQPRGSDPTWEGLSRVSTKAHTTCTLSRISGNAASDKNIKDGVCAQIEKNFARAKWKVRFDGSLFWPCPKCFFWHPQFLACTTPLQLNTNLGHQMWL
jgi:hypothetical protein